MAYELKDGQGSLFKIDNRTSDNHPIARGEALIGGVLYEVAAWTKEGRKGKFQSLSFKPKEARREPRQDRSSYADRDDPRSSYAGRDDDLDVPF
jgi:hypothetical protein